MIIKSKNKLLVSAFCSMLLSGVYASGSSTDPLPVSEQQTNAQETLNQWREQRLIQLTPVDEGEMNTLLGKDKTSEISEVKTNPVTAINSLGGGSMEFAYVEGHYHVKYDDKIFIFPENSVNKPSLFIKKSDNPFLKDMYLLRLQSLDDKTLQFIPIRLLKFNNRSFEEIQNEIIDMHLTLAEQGLMPAAYALDRGMHRGSMEELLDDVNSEDFRYLSKFYMANTRALRDEINCLTSAARFMSLIKGRSYTAENQMPALFPYINKYGAINLLKTDPDFFLDHLDQFFALLDDITYEKYKALYRILNNKETSVEEKIMFIEQAPAALAAQVQAVAALAAQAQAPAVAALAAQAQAPAAQVPAVAAQTAQRNL